MEVVGPTRGDPCLWPFSIDFATGAVDVHGVTWFATGNECHVHMLL